MQRKAVANVQSVLEIDVSSRASSLLVSAQLNVQESTAAILLRHFGWNAEKLQEQFFNDPSKALSDAGLSPPSSPTARTAPLLSPSASNSSALSPRASRSSSRIRIPVKKSRSTTISDTFECPICCEEYSQSVQPAQTFALSCGHRFCRGCWVEYLNGKIKDEGESGRIQCMESGCNRIVKSTLVDQVLVADMSQR